jgi:hypothetical protein
MGVGVSSGREGGVRMEMDEEKSREMKRAMQMQMQRRDARIDQEGAEVGEVEDVDGGWVVGVVGGIVVVVVVVVVSRGRGREEE